MNLKEAKKLVDQRMLRGTGFTRTYWHPNGKKSHMNKGEYVLTPVLQDDKSVCFYLSKKNMDFAMHCFTVMDNNTEAYKEQIQDISKYLYSYQETMEKAKHLTVTQKEDLISLLEEVYLDVYKNELSNAEQTLKKALAMLT